MSSDDQDSRIASVIGRLRRTGALLPERTHARVLALGDAIVPSLIAILVDERLAASTAPGEGWPPIHAAKLLGELGAEAAIEPMLQVLRLMDFDSNLHDGILLALPKLGAPVVEPVLRAHAEAEDPELRSGLACVLSEAGVRDERIVELLLEQLAEDPAMAASNLGAYGDARALEPVRRAFDTCVDSEPYVLRQLRETIEQLGGTLTDAQVRRFESETDRDDDFDAPEHDADLDEPAPAEPARRPDRPGRNDPCWCGSLRKYKKCHLAEDERGA